MTRPPCRARHGVGPCEIRREGSRHSCFVTRQGPPFRLVLSWQRSGGLDEINCLSESGPHVCLVNKRTSLVLLLASLIRILIIRSLSRVLGGILGVLVLNIGVLLLVLDSAAGSRRLTGVDRSTRGNTGAVVSTLTSRACGDVGVDSHTTTVLSGVAGDRGGLKPVTQVVDSSDPGHARILAKVLDIAVRILLCDLTSLSVLCCVRQDRTRQGQVDMWETYSAERHDGVIEGFGHLLLV
ncbi:hypothetical protein B0T11DRAFT_276232 [Plectosphaerella cucumerina]|uniref:Uncharacterized protein n=1 Tax=Plectosphaerella cucumerina TaxID=40658 RepID=A0A8K0TRJ7_9PEZI|nr:hypothetical protein B0T11DRAFT_276232 [Plectosphaerella cucumerina]